MQEIGTDRHEIGTDRQEIGRDRQEIAGDRHEMADSCTRFADLVFRCRWSAAPCMGTQATASVQTRVHGQAQTGMRHPSHHSLRLHLSQHPLWLQLSQHSLRQRPLGLQRWLTLDRRLWTLLAVRLCFHPRGAGTSTCSRCHLRITVLQATIDTEPRQLATSSVSALLVSLS